VIVGVAFPSSVRVTNPEALTAMRDRALAIMRGETAGADEHSQPR